MVEALNPANQDLSATGRMLRSKYGMLEILRAAYNRRDAILIMRELS